MIRRLSIVVTLLLIVLTSFAAEWHLSVENATKSELSDVTVGFGKHKVLNGYVGPSSRATTLFVSDNLGGRMPTNAVVRYTSTDKKRHQVSVAIPKSVQSAAGKILVISIGDDEKITVTKEKL